MTDAAASETPDRPLTQDGPAVRLWMIDASAYIFRAYHALPPLTRKSDGLPVGAVQGYCNMLWKLIRDMRGPDGPTHLVAIFDHSEKTFRNEMYDQYKANRSAPPEDLIPQFPLIREAAKAFNVTVCELGGFEADDLIATYARMATENGTQVTIVSSDKDLMQLVGPGVRMLDPIKNKTIGEAEVASDSAAEERLEAAGKAAFANNEVVDVELIDVAVAGGTIRPLRLREQIRAAGPSNRTDLGKQARAPHVAGV